MSKKQNENCPRCIEEWADEECDEEEVDNTESVADPTVSIIIFILVILLILASFIVEALPFCKV